MRLPSKTKLFGAAAFIFLCFIAHQILQIKKSALDTLADTRARLMEKNRVAFEKKHLTPHLTNKIRILQNTADVRDIVRFQNSYFAATGGGLVELSEDGKLLRHFTVLDGLPESDLVCLTVWRGRLFVGTRTKNLISFDGEKFEQFVFTDRKTQAVGALLEADGKLLIGTFNGGLIEFDGENFTEIKAGNEMVRAINFLSNIGATLYVGTFDNGLWIYENDVWTHLTTAENLPSNRIVGIAENDGKTYIATDFGLSLLQNKNLQTLAVLPALSGLTAAENRIFLSKDDGTIFTFDGSLKEFRRAEKRQNTRLILSDETIWILSNQGISKCSNGKINTFYQAEKNALTDNFISAIAFDKNENLWLGSFSGGIDVFASGGKKLRHLESETLREINFLQAVGEEISVATSSGRQTIKKDFSVSNQNAANGLPNTSVAHFSGDWTATNKGLTFIENGKIRLLSAANGLPNNSVYTALQMNEKTYAGTLGGLAEIQSNRVVKTYKDSNSNLKTNWVTALIRAGERIFIGTYGGGIFELLPSGEIRSFEPDAGKFVVNPNALATDGERLYAGTLDGVKILDLKTQKWKTIRQILPAETVLSIAADKNEIYFGTTNGIVRVEKDYFENEETQ